MGVGDGKVLSASRLVMEPGHPRIYLLLDCLAASCRAVVRYSVGPAGAQAAGGK